MFSSLKKQAHLRESILAMVGIVAICYLGFSFFYTPAKTKVKELAVKVAEEEERVTGIKKLIDALQKKQDDEMAGLSHQAKQSVANSRVDLIKSYKDPLYKNISEFLNAITQFDFKSNLKIESLNYSVPSKNGGYVSAQFHLVASGQFGKIVEFMQKLEEVPALVSLDSIDINIDKTDANHVSIDLNGTYYQLENENG